MIASLLWGTNLHRLWGWPDSGEPQFCDSVRLAARSYRRHAGQGAFVSNARSTSHVWSRTLATPPEVRWPEILPSAILKSVILRTPNTWIEPLGLSSFECIRS